MTQRYPLTGAQLGIWLAHHVSPASTAFATAEVVELDGAIDPAAFTAAVRHVINGAQALHVRFVDDADGPHQVAAAPRAFEHPVVDLASEADPAASARAWIDADLARPVVVDADPLVRGALLRTGAQQWQWYLYLHHLVTDGYASALILRRVAEHLRTGTSTPIAPLSALLADEQTYLAGQARDDEAFWRTELAGRSAPPTIAGRRAPCTSRPHRSAAVVAATTPFTETAHAHGYAWPQLAAAGVLAWLASMTSEPTHTLALPILDRRGPARRAAGARVNLLPLQVTVDDDAPVHTLVRATSQELARIRPHGRLRFETMARMTADHAPLFGAELNLKPFATTLDFGTTSGRVRNVVAGPVHDLSVQLAAGAGGELSLTLDANPDLYSAALTTALTEGLAATLRACADARALHAPAGTLPTIGRADRQLVVERWNATAHPVPGGTLATALRDAGQAHHAAVALTDADGSLTYAEFHARVALLRGALRRHGAGPGTYVGLTLARCTGLAVAVAATLMEGAAYVPLDPDLPAERRATMCSLAGPVCVIAADDTADLLAGGPPPVLIDRGGQLTDHADHERSNAAAAADGPAAADAAYLLFTSGSTGQPKGVIVEHAAIVNRLAWMQHAMPIGPGDAILQKTPYGFDVSVWELVWPLLHGARLVMAPPGAHREPADLADLIEREAISVVHFVPSMLDQFLAHPGAARCRTLRHVVCSGEALSTETARRAHDVLDTAALHNLYGPTEAAIDVTRWTLHRTDRLESVPIGRPIWNTSAYVLDRAGRPVPPGVAGELWLGGVQLARGYLGRSDLTDAAFRPNHLASTPTTTRLYRTGDVARWRSDGAIDYVGRRDGQVKLGGVRIELGEVEAVLRRADDVAQSAVVVDRAGPHPRLVGYVVAQRGRTVEPSAVLADARQQLPSAMIPAGIVVLDALPVTRNGKLNRQALPPLAPASPAAHIATRPPQTPRERTLCKLFADATGARAFGAEDNLFERGGDSLVAVRLAGTIRAATGFDVRVGALFAAPTPALLARRIDGGHDLSALDHLLALQPHPGTARDAGAGPEPTPVFCVHPAGGLGWCYQGLARTITDRPIIAVQSPTVRGLGPTGSLRALASVHADAIAARVPGGPIHLVGWSVGGVLAHEIAGVLQDGGRTVGVVALLDAYPGEQWRGQPSPSHADTLLALLHMGGLDERALAGAPVQREAVLAALDRAESPLAGLGMRTLDHVAESVLACSDAMRSHRTRTVRGGGLVVRATAPRREHWLSADGWQPHFDGPLTVVDVACTHPEIPHRAPLDRIGAALARALARCDATHATHGSP